jgi:exodeoxyribonuclease VII small subunit
MAKKTETTSSAEAETPLSFETSLETLERIVRELEQGNAPLERGLQLFEEGVALLSSCRKTLEAAELRVREFAEVDESGVIRLKDFEHKRTTGLGGRE